MNRSMAAKHAKARKESMRDSLDKAFRESQTQGFKDTSKSRYPLTWWIGREPTPIGKSWI